MRLLLPPLLCRECALMFSLSALSLRCRRTLAGLAMRMLSGGAMLADDLLTYVKVLGKAKSAVDLEGK